MSQKRLINYLIRKLHQFKEPEKINQLFNQKNFIMLLSQIMLINYYFIRKLHHVIELEIVFFFIESEKYTNYYSELISLLTCVIIIT